ncbi:MAG: hypothetical protein J0L92_21765 [Deltaproteobacteria bacterium]|nr:hypothetical protein [Deltaproteobacteria bacterium]
MRNARVGIVGASVCLAWASSACSAPERTLTVRLQSDYGAQHEARYAEARLFDGVGVCEGSPRALVGTPIGRDDQGDLATGVFGVGVFEALAPGIYSIRVRLLRPPTDPRGADDSGAELASRCITLTLDEDRVRRVPIMSACHGVSCPAAGGSSSFDECLNGFCVDPRCDTADPSTAMYCCDPALSGTCASSTAVCSSDDDCEASVACAGATRCIEGACIAPTTDTCSPSEYCERATGACQPILPSLDDDAGVIDASTPDAAAIGSDAAFDAPSIDSALSDAAGSDGGPDAFSRDAAGPDALPPTSAIAVGSMGSPMAANLACVGVRTAPSVTGSGVVTLRVQGLALTSFDVALREIDVFPGERVRATCDGDCISEPTDTMGLLDVTLPLGGWFGYRMTARGSGATATVPTSGAFVVAPAGRTVTVSVYGASAAGLLRSQLNRDLSQLVVGTVTDCDARPIARAWVRIFGPDGEVLSGPVDDTASPRITGLGDSTIPSPSPDTLTRFSGRFAAALPAGAGTFRIEAWGLERVGDPPLLLACEEVFVDGIDDGVTIAPLGPVRSDYVAESGCLRP